MTPRPSIQYTPSDIAVQRRERYLGWMRMNAAEAGGDDVSELVFADDSWRGDRAAEALSYWMSLPEEKRPTAVFCASDALALRLMEAALQAGVSIPDELSIVGVDDSPSRGDGDRPADERRHPGGADRARGGSASVAHDRGYPAYLVSAGGSRDANLPTRQHGRPSSDGVRRTARRTCRRRLTSHLVIFREGRRRPTGKTPAAFAFPAYATTVAHAPAPSCDAFHILV